MLRLPAEFDLHALEVFVVTVELGGMTASATQLRITQSAVSQTITRLEAGLGTALFDRSLRPLGLTPAGRALYERARRLLTTARTVIDEVREGANLPVDQITLAMSETFATLLTAPVLRRFGMRVGRWRIRSGISLVQQHRKHASQNLHYTSTLTSGLLDFRAASQHLSPLELK